MEAFMGQILQVGFNFAPLNWASCQGQLLSIAQNSAMFALLGTTFGGNGQTTFALPNLQSRMVIGVGQGPGLSQYVGGQVGGLEQVSVLTSNLPSHTHTATFTPSGGNTATVQAVTGVLPTALTSIPAEGSLLANTAPAGPNAPKIYAPAGTTGPVVNLGGVSGGGGGGGTVSVGLTGNNIPLGILPPYIAIWNIICMAGEFPSRP